MKRKHSLALATIAFSAALLTGCAGATRLPTRSRGPEGQNLQTKTLDLAFLDSPGIQRQEVLSRLSMVDTSYSNPRLFWGRWSQSKWGYWWFVAAQGGGAGDAKRVWNVRNLLVVFDENGMVSKKEVFDNDQSFWLELHAQMTSTPELDLSEPLSLDVRGITRLTKINLTKDSMELVSSRRKAPVLRVVPQNIARLSHVRYGAGYHPGYTCHTLHFAEKTEWGKSVSFCAAPLSVATLFRYLQQTGSPTMRWE